jgi:hypothetical protein
MSDKADPREIAKAEAQRQQALLDEIKLAQRSPQYAWRCDELAVEYRIQLDVTRAAWERYRKLQNLRGIR